MSYPIPDLFGLDTVNNGVHHRREEKIHKAHDHLHQMGCLLSKAVDYRQANHGRVEQKYSTDVRNTCVESFESLSPGGNGQHCAQDECIGEKDEQGVHPHCRDNDEHAVDAVGLDVGTGQLHHLLVETVGMRED